MVVGNCRIRAMLHDTRRMDGVAADNRDRNPVGDPVAEGRPEVHCCSPGTRTIVAVADLDAGAG